jgi:signal transduction histidine kinase
LRRDAGRPAVLARSVVERGRRLFPSGSPRLVVDVADQWPDVTMALAHYRNVQLIGYEALQNAARHAEAREVTLRFHPWVLEIVDDGRGLSAISPRAGTATGLAGMRDRATAIGARLEVIDRPGGGTIVRLSFEGARRGRWGIG